MKIKDEIETEIRLLDLGNRKKNKTQDIENSSLEILQIRVPTLKKHKNQSFENSSDVQKLEIINEIIYTSDLSESITWAYIQTEKMPLKVFIDNKEIITRWAYKVENWWHADQLADLYTKILEIHKIFLNEILELNKSENFWARRLSITSLYYYSSQRKNPVQFEIAINLIKNLLGDEEYYVQKGVGWTIRETYNLYPEEIKQFLKEYIKDISPHAFQAATEKLNKEFKEELKELRKKYISNPDHFLRKE